MYVELDENGNISLRNSFLYILNAIFGKYVFKIGRQIIIDKAGQWAPASWLALKEQCHKIFDLFCFKDST